MSMVLNMVGGGGGSLKNTDAILIVTTSVGATVTATKGGITLTPTIWTTNANNTLACALFSIKASTFDSNYWTVKATLNGITVIDYPVINSAKEYELSLLHNLYLFHNGAYGITLDVVRSNTSDDSTATMTIENNLLRLYQKYNSGQTGATYQFGTASAVDVTDYSTMVCVVDNSTQGNHASIGVSTNKSGARTAMTASVVVDQLAGKTYTVDISSLTGMMYVSTRIWCGTGDTEILYISEWYLAR